MEKSSGCGGRQLARQVETQAKPRGRPLKEHADAATDLQRARVRRAQKSFRQRKEQHINALEEKISDLENIVEEMSNVFVGFVDNLLKSRRVEPEMLKQTMQHFVELAQRTTRESDERGGASGDDRVKRHVLGVEDENYSSSKKLLESGLVTSQSGDGFQAATSLYSKQQDRPSVVFENPNYAEFESSNPYQTHIWGIPPNSSIDGASAIPYILAGRDSFASRLYFETIVTIVRGLRGDEPRTIVDSMYRYKRKYVNFDHILGVTSGVLNMLLHGTSQDPTEQCQAAALSHSEVSDEGAIKTAIVEEVVSQGSSEKEYLNTWNVEQYLRGKWGLSIDSRTIRVPVQTLIQAPFHAFSDGFDNTTGQGAFPSSSGNSIPFAPTLIPGFSHTEGAVLNAQSLVEKISMGAVSLGEGPRWHFSWVDGAVQSFLYENKADRYCTAHGPTWEINDHLQN